MTCRRGSFEGRAAVTRSPLETAPDTGQASFLQNRAMSPTLPGSPRHSHPTLSSHPPEAPQTPSPGPRGVHPPCQVSASLPPAGMHFLLPGDSGGLTFKAEDVSELGLNK